MYLEERLQDVEQQVKNMNRNGCGLMERVDELERANTNRTIDYAASYSKIHVRLEKLECAVYNCTDDALKEPITAKDVDRWRAIEKAAAAAVDAWDRGLLFEKGQFDIKDRSPKMGDLRKALKR